VLLLSIIWRGPRLYWVAVGWLRLAIWGARVICGVRARVTGLEHVPTAAQATSAVLLAPKHQSTWETFFFPTLMPHPLAYVFKKELLQVPFFGWAMGRLDMVHIDRSRRTEAWNKVAEQGRRLFSEGTSTSQAPHAWPLRRACPSCPSPWPRHGAGRARVSCCGLAWCLSRSVSPFRAWGASPMN